MKIPAANVRGLTYAEYQLSSLEIQAGETSRFQLYGKDPSTSAWTAIGDPLSIPEVDFGPVDRKIEELSGKVVNLSVSQLAWDIDEINCGDSSS